MGGCGERERWVLGARTGGHGERDRVGVESRRGEGEVRKRVAVEVTVTCNLNITC